jgi:hypothetical protein
VLLAIAYHAEEDGTGAYPAVATLMKMTNLSRRGVQYALRELEDAGELVTLPQRSPRGTNLFRITLSTEGADRAPPAVDSPAEGAQTVHPRAQSLRGARHARVQTAAEGGADRDAEGRNVRPQGVHTAAPDPSVIRPDPSEDPSRLAGARAAEHDIGDVGGAWTVAVRQAPRRYHPRLAALQQRAHDCGRPELLEQAVRYAADQEPRAYWPYLIATLEGCLASGDVPGNMAPVLPASVNGARAGPRDLAGRYRDLIQR